MNEPRKIIEMKIAAEEDCKKKKAEWKKAVEHYEEVKREAAVRDPRNLRVNERRNKRYWWSYQFEMSLCSLYGIDPEFDSCLDLAIKEHRNEEYQIDFMIDLAKERHGVGDTILYL